MLQNCKLVHDKAKYKESNYYFMYLSKGNRLNFNFGLNSGRIKISVKHALT